MSGRLGRSIFFVNVGSISAFSSYGDQVESPNKSDSTTALVSHGGSGNHRPSPSRPSRKPRTSTYRTLTGWRKGVVAAAVTASTVLLINFCITIWASTRQGTSDGIGVLYDGLCTDSRFLNSGLHVIINALSTLLLGASSYTMQCLSSPTRAEVDRAHRKGEWLDIGVPSMRNLTKIGKRRRLLWWLLALSSLPLHLL